jgi:hypothetical protein
VACYCALEQNFCLCNGHGNCMRVCLLVSRSISSKLLVDIGLHLYPRSALKRHVVGYQSALGAQACKQRGLARAQRSPVCKFKAKRSQSAAFHRIRSERCLQCCVLDRPDTFLTPRALSTLGRNLQPCLQSVTTKYGDLIDQRFEVRFLIWCFV